MPLFADVVLLKESKALGERRFTYAVPPHWALSFGQLVRVPFAHQGVLPALVMHLHDDAPQGFTPKTISSGGFK